ncbi:type 4a pilus biogenesis protein PilO [Grimontia sp. NTOU-MAR1]|uniref:type 4a pilus biogenesis protein PilO n=1 Tax=Grimontia sp. NTOU-MAR1 TaxID=3111011 RepID=UPI002DB8C2F9|nr:type 4a pilus biogenesis protein PilO [Grimontia sp. NTOU-MAR1]WRV96993.1 type 4a pilus biogenesis protein PilO [Grimontia sp. NTOU-MAR1]
MNALLTRGKNAFDALSIREQWMIAVAGWVAILGLGLFLFIEPASKALAQLETQTLQSERTTDDLVTLNRLKQEKLHTSPNAELEAELAKLSKEIAELDSEMALKVDGLVTAAQMSSLMESVLRQSERLTLISMNSLPPQQLTDTEDAGYYIHPVEITLEGRYFDIVDYLSTLEALPVKYYWQSVDYSVTEYPIAKVTIAVYTLGESPVFIGGKNEITE